MRALRNLCFVVAVIVAAVCLITGYAGVELWRDIARATRAYYALVLLLGLVPAVGAIFLIRPGHRPGRRPLFAAFALSGITLAVVQFFSLSRGFIPCHSPG